MSSIESIPVTRRRAFGAAIAALGLSYGQASKRLGITYTHLTLVLEGIRVGSARLEAGIRAVFEEARPALRAIAEGAYDLPESPRVLNALTAEYDTLLLEDMQRPEVAAGIERGFAASPNVMGKAAVNAARAARGANS